MAIVLSLGRAFDLRLTSAQQYSLWHGLQAYVMSPSREGLIGMNKEGLVSLPGYLAIYLLGLSTGQHILRVEPISKSSQEAQRHRDKRRSELGMELFSYAVGWWAALILCRIYGVNVSRRLANLPYIVWIAAYNTTFLFGYLLISDIHPITPPLLEAINRNALAIFLIANLMTGTVNLGIQTMYTGDIMAMAVLIAYSVGICGFAWAGRKIQLRL